MKYQTSIAALELAEVVKEGKEFHLGVTGHRDLLDVDEVKKKVLEGLEYVVRKYQPSKIVLHSPLAEGADQLMVDVFEELRDEWENCEVWIHGVLPMSKERYMAEENGEPGVTNLEEYRAKCDSEHEMPSLEPERPRKDGYARLASYFAEKCDAVLAIWDGAKTGYQGGTGDVVEKLRRRSTGVKFQRCAGVVWIVAARNGNRHPVDERFRWHLLPIEPLETEPDPRQKLVEFYRQYSRYIIGGFAIASILFGLLGYAIGGDEICGEGANLWYSLISSFSHFLGNFPFQADGGAPIWLYLSWWCALFFLVLSAGGILNHAFHVADQFWLRRRSRRQHDIVVGVGARGAHLLEDSRIAGKHLIAFDSEPEEKFERLCKRLSVSLVKEDAATSKEIKKELIQNTEQAFVCTGSDYANLQIVHRLSNVYDEIDEKNGMICSVGLKSMEHSSTLRNAIPSNPTFELRIFNREAVTARAFLRKVSIDRFSALPNGKGAQVIIVGEGVQADEMMRQCIQIGHFESGKVLRVFRVCEGAQEKKKLFLSGYPCFDKAKVYGRVWQDREVLPDVEFLELPVSGHSIFEFFEDEKSPAFGGDDSRESSFDFDRWVTTVIICDPDPMKAVKLASEVGSPLEIAKKGLLTDGKEYQRDISLWFHFPSPNEKLRRDLTKRLDNEFRALPVGSFIDFLGPCHRECALGERIDAVARRINGFYWGLDIGNVDKIDEVWRETTEHDKDSSRQAAEHCWVKHRIRERLKSSRKTPDEIESELALIEHRRWCCELLIKGFRPLTRIPALVDGFVEEHKTEREETAQKRWFDPKNKQYKKEMKNRRLHIDLLPYDDLPTMLGEEQGTIEQAKDRAQVRVLDDLLFGVE